ncbi:hypothetical protein [Wolbachia pipientis]|uniref:hypothetical protein n=1 Tax=Wolbachia pipientis TaxID=955 RepID=UPI0021BD61CD|nr:hypothetical protein [Wolbachia pipientis]
MNRGIVTFVPVLDIVDTVCIVFSEFVVGALVGIVVIIVACEVAIVSATVVGSDDVLICIKQDLI